MADLAEERALRSLRPGALVSLYELDLRPVLERIEDVPRHVDITYRFVNSKLGAEVAFNGKTYVPWPIIVEGLALADSGPLPRPTIDITDDSDRFVFKTLDAWDPTGAIFRHKIVWAQNLDFGSDPNPLAIVDVQEYEVHTYVMATVCQIGLVSDLDKLNDEFPRYTIAQARAAR